MDRMSRPPSPIVDADQLSAVMGLPVGALDSSPGRLDSWPSPCSEGSRMSPIAASSAAMAHTDHTIMYPDRGACPAAGSLSEPVADSAIAKIDDAIAPPTVFVAFVIPVARPVAAGGAPAAAAAGSAATSAPEPT